MTTVEKTPIEKYVEKWLKEAEKNGWEIKQLPYKDRVRTHAVKRPPDKK